MKDRKMLKLQIRMPQCRHSREGGNPVLYRWIPGQARNDKLGGFTLVELILVVLIISIAAVIAIPMFASAADIQVRSVANCIAADLDYARGLAITRQKNYAVVFYPSSESYDIREAGGSIIKNPLTNTNFAVNLAADSRVSGVNINSADFDSSLDYAITFDYLGTPYAGNVALPTAADRLDSQGLITLKSKDNQFVLYVKVEALTGTVTIDDE
jgi:prepilin-type N-terminal cleavage/methylation domain-containing protein